MNLLLTLTHWTWWLTSPTYRREFRDLRNTLKHKPNPALATTHTLVGGQTLRNVHPVDACAGAACCIHNPSNHHMDAWAQNWRTDRALMERICPCGIGHPDPDHVTYLTHTLPSALAVGLATQHGCCGCCIDYTRRP